MTDIVLTEDERGHGVVQLAIGLLCLIGATIYVVLNPDQNFFRTSGIFFLFGVLFTLIGYFSVSLRRLTIEPLEQMIVHSCLDRLFRLKVKERIPFDRVESIVLGDVTEREKATNVRSISLILNHSKSVTINIPCSEEPKDLAQKVADLLEVPLKRPADLVRSLNVTDDLKLDESNSIEGTRFPWKATYSPDSPPRPATIWALLAVSLLFLVGSGYGVVDAMVFEKPMTMMVAFPFAYFATKSTYDSYRKTLPLSAIANQAGVALSNRLSVGSRGHYYTWSELKDIAVERKSNQDFDIRKGFPEGWLGLGPWALALRTTRGSERYWGESLSFEDLRHLESILKASQEMAKSEGLPKQESSEH